MSSIIFRVLPVEQPIGTFFLSKVRALDLVGTVDVVSRKDNLDGVQRELSDQRVKEISNYCDDPDATFPTPIIISVYNDVTVGLKGDDEIEISFERSFGDVIDGQHRLKGIFQSSRIGQFELPVILMFDLTLEEKAYVFSTINSNQKKVDKSLIYDLFDVSTGRSPQRTAHEIARAMNTMQASPFCNRLKMLGKKTPDQPDATISQGTFSKRLVSLITKNEKLDYVNCKNGVPLYPDARLPFRKYFIEDKDEIILKIMLNCFYSLRLVFPKEWEVPQNNILWKTTGFNAVMDSLRVIVPYGLKEKSLTVDFFSDRFRMFRDHVEEKQISLTSDNFGSGESETTRLKRIILSSMGLEEEDILKK